MKNNHSQVGKNSQVLRKTACNKKPAYAGNPDTSKSKDEQTKKLLAELQGEILEEFKGSGLDPYFSHLDIKEKINNIFAEKLKDAGEGK